MKEKLYLLFGGDGEFDGIIRGECFKRSLEDDFIIFDLGNLWDVKEKVKELIDNGYFDDWTED